MNLPIDLDRQQVLDEAIKLLYKSRPAKAAALLGLLEQPSEPISLAPNPEAVLGQPSESISLAPNPAALKQLSVAADPSAPIADEQAKAASQIFRSGPLPYAGPNVEGTAYANNTLMSNFKNPSSATAAKEIGDKLVGGDSSNPPFHIGDSVSKSSEMGSIVKSAMSDEDALYYKQLGIAPSSIGGGYSNPLSLGQVAALGVGGVGLVGANRLRASNTAARDLSSIRREYLQSVQEGTLDARKLKLLNQELKLRSAPGSLRIAPTLGIADAHMLNAEKGLSRNILKSRYRGTAPLLAATLLGTVAYNKLNEV